MRIPFFTHRREMRQMHEKLDELLKLNRRRELLVAAAENLAEKLDDEDLAHDISNHFCVSELFPIVQLLEVTGRNEAAKWWAETHDDWADFMSDDEPEDQDETTTPFAAAI
ncbi:hypothetical protein [Streptomyces scabiei]|uniref:hypothetical protein n=1 Tax=Streptomyces scabiei TaxID=1930 RepID=UPI0037990AEF